MGGGSGIVRTGLVSLISKGKIRSINPYGSG